MEDNDLEAPGPCTLGPQGSEQLSVVSMLGAGIRCDGPDTTEVSQEPGQPPGQPGRICRYLCRGGPEPPV